MLFFNGKAEVEVNNLDILSNINQDLANDLAIGPQETFLNYLEGFNEDLRYHNIDILGVTKLWNWKAGSYDRMKDLIKIKLALHKKSNGMDYLIDRTRDHVNYLSYIQSQARRMEHERKMLKHTGVAYDVDIDEFKVKCNEFYDSISSQLEQIPKLTDNKLNINVYTGESRGMHKIYYEILLQDLMLNIFQGKGHSAKCIQEIPLEPIRIVIMGNLRAILNGTSGHRLSSNGHYFDSRDILDNRSRQCFLYPYLSSSYINNYSAVCFDHYLDSIHDAIRKGSIINMSMEILQWAQYYNTSFTNPYSQPYFLHLGMPKSFSKEYSSLWSKDTITSECTTRVKRLIYNLEDTSYEDGIRISNNMCHENDCALMSYCNFYIAQKERLETLENEVFMFQLEAVAGWTLENVRKDSLKYDYESITGEYLKTNADETDIEIDFLNQIKVWLLKCYSYDLFEFIERRWDYWDIEESKTEEEKENDKLKELMKRWAFSSERGEI